MSLVNLLLMNNEQDEMDLIYAQLAEKMLASYNRLPLKVKEPLKTNLYFIQELDSKRIKIGLADSPVDRLKNLQTCNGSILKIIKIIVNVEPKIEKVYHKKFKQYHIHGEWFSGEIERLL